jgi:hypothetical protein
MAETKTKKQVAFLLSKGSPLSESQRSRLLSELKTGKVKVVRDEKTNKKSTSS